MNLSRKRLKNVLYVVKEVSENRELFKATFPAAGDGILEILELRISNHPELANLKTLLPESEELRQLTEEIEIEDAHYAYVVTLIVDLKNDCARTTAEWLNFNYKISRKIKATATGKEAHLMTKPPIFSH